MDKIIIKHYDQKDAEEETTAFDPDDYISAATGGDSSCGQTRSGKQFHRSSQSPGEEVILAGSKRRIVMREKPCSEAERAILDQVRAAEEVCRALGVETGDTGTADALVNQVATDVDLICRVATEASNLKGTFVRALKDSAASIKAVVEVLRERTASEEVPKLQSENSRLRRDLDDLRRLVVELREHHSEQVAPTCLPRQGQDFAEELRASVDASVGRMIDARLTGMEEWLPPAKTFRPPLAADKRTEKTTQKAPSSITTSAPVQKRRAPATEESEPVWEAGDGQWTTVVRRKKKKSKKTTAKTCAAAAAAAPTPKKKAQPQPQPQRRGCGIQGWPPLVLRRCY
ncbi:unnamed protein product [Euphydryas editha]|uniref:Uncharacterized protein n=1 Tax=Euphydryas editha TaxID=104508 RepID=A0AAU9VEU1_EUPED|nr:unnamed protein product [Euphydryas editha]